MGRFSGKVALVTGGSKGIGKSTALQLAREGAKVMVSSRNLEPCQDVVKEIEAAGGIAAAAACNISHADQLTALVKETEEKLGQIDVLVCNAAVNPFYGPLGDIPQKAYDKTMNSNVYSVLQLCNMILPSMAERGGGSVVTVGSIAGLRGSKTIGAYSVSKAAAMHLTRCLAIEWGASNIRVNTVAPGLIQTDFAKARWEDDEVLAETIKTYPIGRIGKPEEVAAAITFLASDEAGFITGQVLPVDGGVTVGGG